MLHYKWICLLIYKLLKYRLIIWLYCGKPLTYTFILTHQVTQLQQTTSDWVLQVSFRHGFILKSVLVCRDVLIRTHILVSPCEILLIFMRNTKQKHIDRFVLPIRMKSDPKKGPFRFLEVSMYWGIMEVVHTYKNK